MSLLPSCFLFLDTPDVFVLFVLVECVEASLGSGVSSICKGDSTSSSSKYSTSSIVPAVLVDGNC